MKFTPFNYLAALTLFLVIVSCEQQQEQRPNIVLIMADDMGYECLGVNGSTEYETPNLDRLAGEGIHFKQSYSQPLCTPSRVKIMTGKYNYRNYEDFGYLNPNQMTFGNLLKEAGYATCIAGKWQLNGLYSKREGHQDVNRPYEFGFDEYCLWQLTHGRGEGERFANPLITQNGEDLRRDPDAYGPQVFTDYICDFIDRKAGEPFFVYFPMVLVHEPFVPTPDSPEWADPERRYEKDTAYFADMMAYTDKIVAQLENKLKEHDVWDNTIFIFTADNGTHRTVWSSTTYGEIRGAKGLTVNTGHHVPMILTWPDKIKSGKTAETLVSFNDFVPTFCEAAGISPEKYETDGKSLLPLFTGESDHIQQNIFIHYTPRWGRFKHSRWVQDDKYKLYRDGRFYNTVMDSLEKSPLNELSGKEEEIKSEFQQVLNKHAQEVPFEMNNEEFKLSY